MTDAPLIRPARVEDAARLGEIKRAGFDPEFLALTIWRSPNSWRYFEELAATPVPFLWVAEHEGLVRGYVHVVVTPESWHLNDIAVATEAQGGGVGAALFRHFEEVATTLPRPKLTLDVDAANSAARAWYTRRGFCDDDSRVLLARDLYAPLARPYLDARFERLEEGLADEARRGFGRAWFLGEGARTEFGLLAGDALRIDYAAEEPASEAICARFPERRTLLTSVPDGADRPSLLADSSAPRRTLVRMKRGAA